MVQAFLLALAQLSDRRVLAVLLKSMGVTLLLFAVLGWLGWWWLDVLLERAGLRADALGRAEEWRGLLSLLLVLLGGWLLWRIVALAVLQFFADEVVEAVEARHYPHAHANARRLGWRDELTRGLAGAGRALLFNLLALPVALVLLVTGIGPMLVFWLVNAVLLGRELSDMAWLRHSHAPLAAAPIPAFPRVLMGGVVTAMLSVPFVNLLAPVVGAAMATHMVHRNKGVVAR